MRNGRIGLASAVVFASTMAAGGCSSSSSSGNSSGGSSGSNFGGSTGAGGDSCPTVEPCGGDVVGTWTVSSSCLTVGGELDFTSVGAGCPSRPVAGSIHVTGSWTAKANNTYTDDTKTTGDEQFRLTAPCLIISSTPVSSCDKAAGLLSAGLGYSSLSCSSASGGECDCSAKIDHPGSAGVSSPAPSASGTYSISGNVLSLSGESDDVSYSYCVSGNKLTLTPKSAKPVMSGAIVLQKSDSSGSGGSTGSGGQNGSGGVTGSGGATGQGGSGGKSSDGGATGSGGSNAGGQGGKNAAGGATGSGGASAAGGSGGTSSGKGPCDIYAAANTPCVAAHSVVRALYSAYNDKLYQVRRADNTTKDILPLVPGGIADTGPEDTFCAGSTCVLTVVYDQSGKGNDLWYQGSTQVPASPSSKPANAIKDPVTVGGHKVYSVFISPNNCYWHDGSKSGMATGAEPEGMYMVTSSRNANGGCCFDYGNSETDRTADGEGTMDALNFSTTTAWGSGAGSGPWVMADMEYGLFTQTGNTKNPNDPTQTAPFVTAVLKNDGAKEYALRGGDATTAILTTYYKGALPGPKYSPMRKQGALILGCGGDCCKPNGGANASSGIFFEGAIVTGYPTDATEDAVQASILAAGYGK